MQQPTPSTGAEIGSQQVIVLAHIGFVLTGVVTTLLGPLLPILLEKWAINDSQAGYLFTAQFAGSMTGVALSGALVRRAGLLRSLAAGFAIMAAGVAVLGASAWAFGTASVFCYGIGLGITIPATNLFISDSYPTRRAAALNLLNFAWGLGAVASPPVIGLLARRGNMTASLAGLAMLLAALAVWLVRCRSIDAAAGQSNADSQSQAASQVWRSPFVYLLCAMAFLYVGTENAVGGWVASYALRLDRSAESLWAMIPSIFWGALLLGRIMAPVFLRRLRGNLLAVVGLVMAVIGITLLLATASLSGLSAGVFMAGFGLASVYPNTIAVLSQWFGAMAARVGALFFTMSGLGGAVIPWIVGQVSTYSGSLRTGLIVAVAGCLAMTGLQAVVILLSGRKGLASEGD